MYQTPPGSMTRRPWNNRSPSYSFSEWREQCNVNGTLTDSCAPNPPPQVSEWRDHQLPAQDEQERADHQSRSRPHEACRSCETFAQQDRTSAKVDRVQRVIFETAAEEFYHENSQIRGRLRQVEEELAAERSSHQEYARRLRLALRQEQDHSAMLENACEELTFRHETLATKNRDNEKTLVDLRQSVAVKITDANRRCLILQAENERLRSLVSAAMAHVDRQNGDIPLTQSRRL